MSGLLENPFLIALAVLALLGIVFAQSALEANSSSTLSASNVNVAKSQLSTANGLNFDIYSSGPDNARVGILIVHDWFGISEFTKESVARLGSQGYRVVAVDLYDGDSATTHQDAFAYMNAVDPTVALGKIDAAINYLSRPNRKIATMGFSMGAPYALEANLQRPEDISATVLFYGEMERDPSRLQSLESPVLVLMGSGDNPEGVFEFSRQMDSVGKEAEIYIYPQVGHAYAQPLFNQGANYDETATRLSWVLVDDFLERHTR
jgi:carboxymethylenebutenolidase